MTRKHFGTDGIRGRANGTITPDLAMRVGMAAGLVFQRGDCATASSSARTRGSPAT